MYFTKVNGLKGTIKHRYSDFIVQEISLDGKKARIIPEGVSEDYIIPKNVDNNKFLLCTMQKTNISVQDVIKKIALNQRFGQSRIGFAGLKDKRGITAQRISIFEPNIELLQKFNYKQIKLFDFSWSDKPIKLGDLNGNSFTIIIRDLDKTEKEIKTILKRFKSEIKTGIPNYFGRQRFGGIRQITHLVGKLFFEGKIKDAVLLYLDKTTDKEPEEITNARNLAREGKYLDAFKQFKGRNFRFERAVLNSLIKEPNNFVNAFQQLPKNLMILFAHAYQSYLFNKYLDLRLKLLGKDYNNKISGDRIEKDKIMGPLFGYEYKLSDDKNGLLEKETLKSENVNLSMFKVKSFPQMSVKGAHRPINLNVNNFKLLEIGDDEFYENKKYVKLSFDLIKNSYATVVLDELMKLKN